MRKAQTRLPDGTTIERDWYPHELYTLYVRGFRDGVGGKVQRKDHEELLPYLRGYNDGITAVQAAATAYADEVGYEPSVLRNG